MLSNLRIRNLALIESLDLEFDSQLNVISGETGAGKSIMIGAVQLLFGQRADRSQIRKGAESCDVSAIIDVANGVVKEVDVILEAGGCDACDEGQLVIRRKIIEGSSKNFVNGCPVPLKVLKDLREPLMDVHGPYDNQSLLKPARQLDIVDDFARLAKALVTYRVSYDEWAQLKTTLESLQEETPSPELLDYLAYQLKEIETVALVEGEEDALSERHAKASHSQRILEIVTTVRTIVADSDDCVTDSLANALKALDDLFRIDEPAATRFSGMLENTVNVLRELDSDLFNYGDEVEIDPDEFRRMEDRLGELRRVKRKYGGTIESVLAHAEECREKIRRLDNFDDYKRELEEQVADARKSVLELADGLREKRKKAADKLGPKITKKLKFLGFKDCRFALDFVPTDPTPTGCDRIDFTFAPNPGEGMKSLREIASSGEISRVMLALKTVLAHEDKVPILIFDEVDANVGGKTAHRVGEELRRLGESHQVICITHQPQVAATGHKHFTVSKSVQKRRTVTTVTPLDEDGRVPELIRMLGGDVGESVVTRHAEELIAKART